MTNGLLDDGWDFYCHTSPCLLPRWGSALDVTRSAAGRGMAGLVLQTHHESTHSRAVTAAQAAPGPTVLGGITLNRFVGGVSRLATRAALRAGGCFVWLPTLHSAAHVRRVGAGRSLSGVVDPVSHGAPLTVARAGALTADMLAVLDEIEEHGGVLCTGHASMREIDALVPEVQARRISLVVNHPYFVIRPSKQWWRDLPADGVYAQLAAITQTGPLFPTIAEAMQVVDLLGAHRCVVGSEMQQADPFEAIERFGGVLLDAGLPVRQWREMLARTPLQILKPVLARREA
jgi:hypothetical protein